MWPSRGQARRGRGATDARLDEVPVAFVELKSGIEATEADLIAFCRGTIASYKVPRAVYFMAPKIGRCRQLRSINALCAAG